jgi:hypothetical protein
MPTITVNSVFGYFGVIFLFLGIFLLLTGLGIINIKQVTVAPGKKTWIVGLILSILGIVSISMEKIDVSRPIYQTPTIQPEEYAINLLHEAEEWPLVQNSVFDSGSWPTEDGPATAEVTGDGHYIVTISFEDDGVGSQGEWIFPILDQVYDFYLNVEAKYISGNEQRSYGLLFHSDGLERPVYLFRVYEKAQLFDVHLIDDPSWRELSGKTPSTRIKQGEFNRLTVVAKGSHYYFYINGIFVLDIVDGSRERGNVGIRISVDDGGEDQVVELRNFELRYPED